MTCDSDTGELLKHMNKPTPGYKANVERFDAEDHPARQSAEDLIKRAGTSITMLDQEYLGSAVVHFYRHKDQFVRLFATAQQVIGMEQVQEGHADAGFKELQRTMMGAYGRTPPRTTKKANEL